VQILSAQAYFLNGSAVDVGNDCYRLTTTQGNQNGTVWYSDQINVTEPFEIIFEMLLGALDDNGADGIVFILQTDGTDAIGNTGEGMGYSGFSPSLGIEFDTWQNGNLFDPTYDHIAVQSNGNVNHNSVLQIADPVQASEFSVNVENGQYHTVKITWEPLTNTLEVYFDCNLRISTLVNMQSIFGVQEEVYWGFSGATGGAWNTQIVCLSENILDLAQDVSICNGGEVELFVGGDPDGTFSWSPIEFLDDPNSQSPTANPDTTTTFTVEYTDLCGDVSIETLTVFVQELEVLIPDIPEINCANPVVEVIADSNFPSTLDYVWTTDDGLIIEGGDTESPTIGEPGTYNVTGSFNNQCFDTEEITIVADYSDFAADINSSGDITCLVDEATISVGSDFTEGVTYDWSTNDGNIVNGQGTTTINVDEPGTYSVEVYLNENCNTVVEVEVLDDVEGYPVEAAASSNIDCDNDEAEIEAIITGNNPDIEWETADGNIVSGLGSNSIHVDAGGTYILTITNPNNGCESSVEVEIIEDLEVPDVSIDPVDPLTCTDPNVHLNATAPGPVGFDYSWTTLDGNIVDGSGSLNPLVDQPGTYYLTVTNLGNGCVGNADEEVDVSEDFYVDISALTMPNVFSPNQDGKNEFFKPFLANNPDFEVTEIMQEYNLKVFNRWGNLVFESTGANRLWDGTSDGNALAGGSYYYMLSFTITCSVNEEDMIDGQVQLVKSE
jgi:gliding motility-associated-like protein